MSKKSNLIVAAAIAVLGLNSQAFAQSFNSNQGTGHELSPQFANNGGRDAGIEHDSLATVGVTTGPANAASCSDQIADLRQVGLLNHQPMPETVWQVRTYAELMFAAELALAEAQGAVRREGECVLAVRRAKQEIAGVAGIAAAK